MADPLTHALDIGTFTLWLSAGAAGVIGVLVPAPLAEIRAGGGSAGGAADGPVFLMEDRPDPAGAAPAPAAEAVPAAADWSAPPALPEVATPGPLPEIPVFSPAAPAGGGGVAARLAAGDTPGPLYPPYSRRMGQSGTAVVQFTVTEQGRVVDASIYTSSGWNLLDREALRTVYGWRYPAGERMNLIRPIVFRLP